MKKQKLKEKKEKLPSLYSKFLKPVRTRVMCIKCDNCGDIIYSRATHDYHSCRCGNVSIDGGFDYIRCSWKNGAPPKPFPKYVNATKAGLYNDWNWQENNYGIIGAEKWQTKGLKKI